MFSIYVDADSSGNIHEIEDFAKSKGISLYLYCDSSHEYASDYAEIRYVVKGKDAADFAILKKCKKDDVVITRDYALAAMASAKHAVCFHPDGRKYTEKNIMPLLTRRYMKSQNGHARKSSRLNVTGFKPYGITTVLEEYYTQIFQDTYVNQLITVNEE